MNTLKLSSLGGFSARFALVTALGFGLLGCTQDQRSGSATRETTVTGSAASEEAARREATNRELRQIDEMVSAGLISPLEGERRRNRVLGLPAPVTPSAEAPRASSPTSMAATPVAPSPVAPAPVSSAPVAPSPVAVGSSVVATIPGAAVDGVSPAVAAQLAGLRTYRPEVVLSNQRLRSTGSDTMDVLMAAWENNFAQYHNRLRVEHNGQGTSTAIPALISGADFGPMSRRVLEPEREAFVQRFGFEPTELPVALDALAVYVHPSNPIARRGLTLAEVDAIFSSTRNRQHPDSITTWGDLGLTGEFANQPIRVYSRNRASGTYAFFNDVVLKKGTFRDSNVELPSSEQVVESVSRDRFGIGFSGIGYKIDSVETVPLSESGANFIAATGDNALNGSYPLGRFLFLAIAHNPNAPVNHLHREFLRFVYSPQGQRVVLDNGYFPVNRTISDQALASLGF